MAGPIGMAVLQSLVRLRCPHCGHVQARAKASYGVPAYRVCRRCHKHFDEAPKRPAPRRR